MLNKKILHRSTKAQRVSALRTGRLYPSKYFWYSFLLEPEPTAGPHCSRQDFVNDTIGHRPRDFPTSSAVPQPRALTIRNNYWFFHKNKDSTHTARNLAAVQPRRASPNFRCPSDSASSSWGTVVCHTWSPMTIGRRSATLVHVLDKACDCGAETRQLDRLTLGHALCDVICLSS